MLKTSNPMKRKSRKLKIDAVIAGFAGYSGANAVNDDAESVVAAVILDWLCSNSSFFYICSYY